MSHKGHSSAAQLKVRNYILVGITGLVVVSMALGVAYKNRHLQDDSLLLGSGIFLLGILTIITGLLIRRDSKKQ